MRCHHRLPAPREGLAVRTDQVSLVTMCTCDQSGRAAWPGPPLPSPGLQYLEFSVLVHGLAQPQHGLLGAALVL